MEALNAMMDRLDHYVGGPPTDGIYACQLITGAMDSDDDSGPMWSNPSAACDSGCGRHDPPAARLTDAGPLILPETICQAKTLLVYDGPTVTIEPGDGAWVPVRVESSEGVRLQDAASSVAARLPPSLTKPKAKPKVKARPKAKEVRVQRDRRGKPRADGLPEMVDSSSDSSWDNVEESDSSSDSDMPDLPDSRAIAQFGILPGGLEGKPQKLLPETYGTGVHLACPINHPFEAVTGLWEPNAGGDGGLVLGTNLGYTQCVLEAGQCVAVLEETVCITR